MKYKTHIHQNFKKDEIIPLKPIENYTKIVREYFKGVTVDWGKRWLSKSGSAHAESVTSLVTLDFKAFSSCPKLKSCVKFLSQDDLWWSQWLLAVGLGSSCSQSRRHRRANLDRGEAIIVDSRLRWIMLMLSEHPWLFYLANRIWSHCTAIIIKCIYPIITPGRVNNKCSRSHNTLRGIQWILSIHPSTPVQHFAQKPISSFQ